MPIIVYVLIFILGVPQIPMTESHKQPQVIAHRGGAGLWPENTLGAFARAMDLGVEGIEFDVRLSKDEKVIVYHDPRLNPALTRDESGAWLEGETPLVKDLSLESLKSYRLGKLNRGHPYAQKYLDQEAIEDEQIPELKEVFELAREKNQKDLLFFIEIKHSPEEPHLSASPKQLAEKVVAAVRDAGVEDRAILMAFNWEVLEHVKKQAPHLARAHLTVERDTNTVKPDKSGSSPWLAGYDVHHHGDSVPQAIEAAGGQYWGPLYLDASKKKVAMCHRHNLKVNVWTPNDEGSLKECLEKGVDAITTNYPGRLLKVLGRLKEPEAHGS